MMSKKNLLRNLFLLLLLSQLSRLLAGILTAKGYQWQMHDVSMHLSVCFLIWFIFSALPYRELAAKCMLIGWLGFEFMALCMSITNVFGISMTTYPMSFQCVIAALVSALYAARTYSHVSDELDDVNIFLCRLKPRSLQDLLLAMMPSGLGGIAVYYQGTFYHFHNGVMEAGEFLHQNRYVVQRAGIPKPGAIQELDKLKGQKWAAHRNCLTTLYPIVKMGRPIV